MLKASLLMVFFILSKLPSSDGGWARKGPYPYVVYVKFPHEILWKLPITASCGGTIVNSNTVITAALCVCKVKKNFEIVEYPLYEAAVIAGTADPNEASSSKQELPIEDVMIHPEFDMVVIGSIRSAINDVALVSLKGKLNFGEGVQPMSLACDNQECMNEAYSKFIAEKTVCITPGWIEMKDLTVYFAIANVHVITPEKCSEVLCAKAKVEKCQVYVPSYQAICSLPTGNQRVCGGLPGGPLICNGYVYGVVNTITCEGDTPAKYTNLHSILAVLKSRNIDFPLSPHHGTHPRSRASRIQERITCAAAILTVLRASHLR
ncbi:Hypothetical protein NTJ_06117 [Nesidiocoris tenuis]|uniref:Peptidase S1 domain-containing protein n=1 Tax=Nesidiocoris tenuis TaxID=355587 RepID=A0ABN7AMY7_9HEMI|nr:Hypothetical protein NTJ_06117 [Nesidiocoris tenuis]